MQAWRCHNTQLQTILHSNKTVCTYTKTDIKTSGTKDPDMNACSYTNLTFDRAARKIQYRKDSFFNKFFLGKLGPAAEN
jgi:hypothetical protein